MNKFLTLPQGVKDFGPVKAESLRKIETGLLEEFSCWGYRKVVTPLFEHLDTLSLGIGENFKHRLMKFVDPHTGEIVVLRPDITPQIGRMVATRLRDYKYPLRLCYSGRVVRYEEKGSGKEREVFQLGCELAGLEAGEGDSEIIALSVKSLNRLGLKNITLNLGHVGVLDAILAHAGDVKDELVSALLKKDQERIDNIVGPSGIPGDIKEVLLSLSDYYGDAGVLRRAAKIESFRPWVEEILSVLAVLEEYKVECDILVDLVEVKGFDYYTGVTFEVLSSATPDSLVTGGRYDGLTQCFGHSVPAAGFAIDAEVLMSSTKNSVDDNQVHFIVVPRNRELRAKAIRLAEWLRSSNFKVILDLDGSYADLAGSPGLSGDIDIGSLTTYGIIKLESSSKIKLVESRSGSTREFSNLEELLRGGL